MVCISNQSHVLDKDCCEVMGVKSSVQKEAPATPAESADDKERNEIRIKWKERIVTMEKRESFDREVTNKRCVNSCELRNVAVNAAKSNKPLLLHYYRTARSRRWTRPNSFTEQHRTTN